MAFITETERLILREIELSDTSGMFELDSNPDVLRYLSEPLVNNIEESRKKIINIKTQYLKNGVGRWAVIEKSTGEFLGWAGLKLEKKIIYNPTSYYDIGYRFIKKFWGNGFATEAARACIKYGFENFKIGEIYADTDSNNLASKNVLEKIGLKYMRTFNDKGFNIDWYKVSFNQFY
jgi:ribosomal-protein-alanine N-acetyltransferase